MSILLIFENKDVVPWKKVLEKKLPNISVEIYPNVKEKSLVEFIVCWKPKKDVFKEFPNLKVIQSIGAGVDHITSTQTINERHTITRIVDEKLTTDMWEFLLTIVLTELKNIQTYLSQKREQKWLQHNYKSISNTIVSILGLGNIGSFVAQKFADTGFNVKGWSNSKKNIKNVTSYYKEQDFDVFLSNTDFLINLLPLTETTKNILNKNNFNKLPKNSYVINVGRGEHLAEEDLIDSINSSHLAGAWLDVFREEPLPVTHKFWHHPKIKITPHIASITSIESAIKQIVENYKRFLNNEELINTVSLKKGY